MNKLIAPNLSNYKSVKRIYRVILNNLTYYVSCKLSNSELYDFIYERLCSEIKNAIGPDFDIEISFISENSINSIISEKIIGLDKFDWICQNIKQSDETRIVFIDEKGNKFQGLINNEKYEKICSLLFSDCY